MDSRPIGVFDSGVGGLSVLMRCTALLPDESYIYLADKANMPYGRRSGDEIRLAAVECARTLAEMNCKAIVIACNTATEHAAADIRRLFPTLCVVGLEPAVKPCAAELGDGEYGVALVTEATAASARFNSLISACGGRIAVAPQPRLAELIEHGDIEEIKSYVYNALDRYRDASAVILGCSHYSHITEQVREFYGGSIRIYDGAEGAARRLCDIIKSAGRQAPRGAKLSIRFYATVIRR